MIPDDHLAKLDVSQLAEYIAIPGVHKAAEAHLLSHRFTTEEVRNFYERLPSNSPFKESFGNFLSRHKEHFGVEVES